MEFKIGGKTRALWQIRAGTAFLLFSVVFCVLSVYSIYLYIPAVILAALGCVAVFWYLPSFFKKYRVFVGKNAVVVTRGVFIVTSHIMPYKRLVFAVGYSTPFSRMLGLKGVTLRAARATVIMPEIDRFAADELIFELGGEKKND